MLGVHEGSVVAMADGYARGTGRPAFVSLHIAAGLANDLIGRLNARRPRAPLVVAAGQQDGRHLQQDPTLSGDLIGLATPAVKAVFDIRHARDLPPALRRAFALAIRPPAGPVFLSLPMDVLGEDIEVEVPARAPARPGRRPGARRAAARRRGPPRDRRRGRRGPRGHRRRPGPHRGGVWGPSSTTSRGPTAINLAAPFVVTRAALSYLRAVGWGRVVSIVCAAVFTAPPGMVPLRHPRRRA
ncbi:thiamine pyrophosphate-binding protein [Streptomyces sp. NPDC048419]|uniref:thiamine pyrophosphate-binding protein n=1 Tax=Streptomyces sp. NPDC048419 TaxID=3365547 RepID=UPI0037159FC1